MGGQELPALPVQGGGGQGGKDGKGHGVGEEFLGKGDGQCGWEWNVLLLIFVMISLIIIRIIMTRLQMCGQRS
jgi:hypothetical protein